jgi:hypothetical protein
LKVQRDGRNVTVEVTSDGEGLVSHAGSALLAQIADKSGLTQALSARLADLKQRRSGHDPGRVVRDLAVMLADGGDCLADLGAVRDQDALFGAVASDSTAFRVLDRIASTPGLLDALADAHARAREHVWSLTGAPERVTIEVDATLITSHSEKEGAAGTYKGGYGFHPILAYCDETGEALAAILRPGNAGSNTAADHIAVIQDALAQIPTELIETIEIVVRADSAGATHELTDFCREHRLRYSVGYELTDQIRVAILKIPEAAWVCALATDGSERENGQIAEITDLIRPHHLARAIAGDRAARARASRRASVHRPRRPSLPSPVDRPARPRHSDPRAPTAPTRARRDAHPQRQRHRPAHHALPRLRAQPRLAEARRDRARPCSPGPNASSWPASSRPASPSACPTGCYTSPRAWPFTPAKPRYASTTRGPGRQRSSLHSRASERFPHPPDRTPARTTTSTPPGAQRDEPLLARSTAAPVAAPRTPRQPCKALTPAADSTHAPHLTPARANATHIAPLLHDPG